MRKSGFTKKSGSPQYVGVKENALAFHAFRKICSAVKKAALFEQLITGSLSNHHTIMNTTKATPHHHKCEFAAFRLSKFFLLPTTGVWAPHQKGVGRRSPRAFGARRLSGRVLLARPTPFWSGAKGTRRKAKPCTTSPAGESISLFAEN